MAAAAAAAIMRLESGFLRPSFPGDGVSPASEGWAACGLSCGRVIHGMVSVRQIFLDNPRLFDLERV